MARWLSWLERRPVTAEVVGSSPIRVGFMRRRAYGNQSFHGMRPARRAGKKELPYSMLVLAGVAELADAQDLKSCGANPPYRFDSGRRH